MEFLQGSRPIGADIDIGSAIGKAMRVEAQFKHVGFDGIIAALLAKKYDAILSGMAEPAQGRERVDFADYLIVSLALLQRPGVAARARAFENTVPATPAATGLDRRRRDRLQLLALLARRPRSAPALR